MLQAITRDHEGGAGDRRHSSSLPRLRNARLTAGVSLLVMSVLSALGYLVAVKGLVVPGDPGRTAENLSDHAGLFRVGVLSLYLVAVLDVVVARALYGVFEPVSGKISRLAAWLRMAYAGIFIVAISQLVGVLHLLGGAGQLGTSRADRLGTQALHHINSFTNIWDAGLVVFGLHLFALAYLAHRSGYVPKLFGVLLGMAGFGYVFDSVTRVLLRGSSPDVSALTGLGEFVFALWLVFRGAGAVRAAGSSSPVDG